MLVLSVIAYLCIPLLKIRKLTSGTWRGAWENISLERISKAGQNYKTRMIELQNIRIITSEVRTFRNLWISKSSDSRTSLLYGLNLWSFSESNLSTANSIIINFIITFHRNSLESREQRKCKYDKLEKISETFPGTVNSSEYNSPARLHHWRYTTML